MRKRTWLRIYCGAFLLILVGMAFFGAYSGLPQTETNQDATEIEQQGFLEWAFDDPVSLFTFVLAIFTGVLAVSTILLWKATRRLAEGAERALTQLERPHLKVRVDSSNFRTLCKMFASGNLIHTMRGDVRIVFRNYGEYPAFVRRFHFSVAISGQPPEGEGTLTYLSGDPVISREGETIAAPWRRQKSRKELSASGSTGPSPTGT